MKWFMPGRRPPLAQSVFACNSDVELVQPPGGAHHVDVGFPLISFDCGDAGERQEETEMVVKIGTGRAMVLQLVRSSASSVRAVGGKDELGLGFYGSRAGAQGKARVLPTAPPARTRRCGILLPQQQPPGTSDALLLPLRRRFQGCLPLPARFAVGKAKSAASAGVSGPRPVGAAALDCVSRGDLACEISAFPFPTEISVAVAKFMGLPPWLPALLSGIPWAVARHKAGTAILAAGLCFRQASGHPTQYGRHHCA